VVCHPGAKTSRVFVIGTDRESFTVPNHRLQLASGGAVFYLPTPNNGDEMLYRGKRVVVTSRGPCRSFVALIGSSKKPELVDNHFLKSPDAGE